MDRREFLKLTAMSGIGLSVTGMDGIVPSADASEKIDLAVAHGASPAMITRAAIDTMGGIKRFISRGDVVVIKPNIAWDRLPEQAANTNPDVVATVVKLCFEAGARKVKVFDRPVNDPRRCYVQSGIAPAASALGAEVNYVDERKFREMNLPAAETAGYPKPKEKPCFLIF